MNKQQFKQLIRECLLEQSDEDPGYVEYHSQRSGESPFMMGGTKFEYVNAKYPNGKIDIGVYSFAGDVVYSYDTFRRQHNIKETSDWDSPKKQEYTDVNLWIAANVQDGKYVGEPLSNYGFPYKQGQSVPSGIGQMTLAMRNWNDAKARRNSNLAAGKPAAVSEMTTTSAVQGFYGKHWVDPDPERKRIKSIASKSVGGTTV